VIAGEAIDRSREEREREMLPERSGTLNPGGAMSTRAWVVATALTLGLATGADSQIAERMSRSRASGGQAQGSGQSGSARAQAQGRASGQSQARATTRPQERPSASAQSRSGGIGRAQGGVGRVSGSAEVRERVDRTPPVTSRSSGSATARVPDRIGDARQSGQASSRENAPPGRIGDRERNVAVPVDPRARDNAGDRNRAIRDAPGRGVGVASGAASGGSGPIRGYAAGVPDARYARGWDWDRRRDRNWYYQRDREWYRYWERDRYWNWRTGPIPGWWLDFRWTPLGVSFGWHINLFWSSWDDHYHYRRDHDWLHYELDRIHEEWHLRHGWRGYSSGWYHAHEALHNRLEREHDRWYRRYDRYAWPWSGPEIWLDWGIADPWEYDNGHYDDGDYRDHGWR
jgi:hypothetical protein